MDEIPAWRRSERVFLFALNWCNFKLDNVYDNINSLKELVRSPCISKSGISFLERHDRTELFYLIYKQYFPMIRTEEEVLNIVHTLNK